LLLLLLPVLLDCICIKRDPPALLLLLLGCCWRTGVLLA
jgi:hypothetical protein